VTETSPIRHRAPRVHGKSASRAEPKIRLVGYDVFEHRRAAGRPTEEMFSVIV
jgi:hypothetical protein